MDFKLGIITASLLLIMVQRSNSTLACTNLSDLAEPCGCPLSKETFDPICGSDGKSYLNACFLECKQTVDDTDISVLHKGPCSSKDSPCTCNAIYNPVCGSNGVTYPNECVLKCNIRKKPNIRLKHRGKCADDSHERWRALRSMCHCNPGIGTLCATNGVTYVNFCVLQCKARRDPSIKFDHMGQCEEHRDISATKLWLSTYEPSNKCGCNTVIYARCGGASVVPMKQHSCDLECESREPKQIPCEMDRLSAKDTGNSEDDSKACLCAAVHRPVCATNQETYANICVLHCNAKKDSKIKFQGWGTCENIRLISRKTKQSNRNVRDDTLRKRINNRQNNRYTSKDTYLRAHYA